MLARELSKTFETIRSLPLAELHWVASDGNQQRGECVVLVAGWQAPEGEESISAEALRVLDLLLAELPLKSRGAGGGNHRGAKKPFVSTGFAAPREELSLFFAPAPANLVGGESIGQSLSRNSAVEESPGSIGQSAR